MLQWWLVPRGSGGVACRKGMSYKFYKTAFLQSKEEVKKMNNKLSRMLALGNGRRPCIKWLRWQRTGWKYQFRRRIGFGEENSKERITDLALPVAVSRELETFNILYSQRGEDSENLTNLVDGLLEVDEKR